MVQAHVCGDPLDPDLIERIIRVKQVSKSHDLPGIPDRLLYELLFARFGMKRHIQTRQARLVAKEIMT
jgi:hypothetical protein